MLRCQPLPPRLLRAVLPFVAVLPASLAAQRLAPVAAEQRCDGRVVGAVEFVGMRRELFSRRYDPAARLANQTVLVLQPPTRARLLKRFLLLNAGDVCDEQRRVESERILRAQSYIGDVAIRVLPRAGNDVLLRVETIDEYVLYAETWGWAGLPAGIELGTGNFAGTGKGFRVLAELGRGNELGWGAKYRDTQLFGRPIVLDASVGSRPYADYWSVAVNRPFYTNFQRLSWQGSVGSYKAFYTLRDSAIRDITVEYQRRTANVSGSRRLGPVNAPWYVGGVLEWENAERHRVVQIRADGPTPVDPPAEVATRYPFFDAARAGLTLGLRRVRFHPMRGLGALSAPEDVALGHDTWIGARTGLGALQTEPVDRLLETGTSGAYGSDQLLLRWAVNANWISARKDALPGQTLVAGRTALTYKASEGHLATLSIAGASFRNARVPTQLTFREDEAGLLGYRSANLGGAGRIIVGVEERHRLPLPTRRAEVAIAAMSEAGRLWAFDAPFGVSTPWHVGVGGAIMIAVPAGAKQMVRIEIGVPVNPPPGLQRREVRIFYSDRTGRF